MRRRGLLWMAAGLALLAVGALAGCTPSPAPVTAADRLWQTYGDSLAIATDTYSEAMRSVGAAHARGQITETQLQQAREIGGHVKVALDSARAALLVYATTREPEPQQLALAVGTAQQALLDLLSRLAELGVTP